MPPKSTLAQAQALGLATPQPNDQIHRGDDAITENARYTADALTQAAAAEALAVTRAAAEDALQDADDSTGVAFGMVDANYRRLWLEAGHDGGPTPYAAEKLGNSAPVVSAVGAGIGMVPIEDPNVGLSYAITDRDGRRLEFELDTAGRVTPRVLNAWAARMGNTGDYPSAQWAAWGDSLTESTWPGKLAQLLGVEVYGGGVGGQKIGQIAARQGGTPARVTLTGNTIPTEGTVTVSTIVNTPLSPGSNHKPGSARRGTIAGVEGTLTRSDDGTTHTFTRTAPGAAVTVAPGTHFLPADATTRRDRITTIWAGRNDLEPTLPDTPIPGLVSRVQSMIDYLTPAVRRVMVLEVPPYATETIGSGGRVPLDAYNDALRGAFPAYWVPIAAWLRTDEAAAAAGITFTTQDRTDISNGITPSSFRADDVHLNNAGNTAVAARLRTEAITRGWI